MSYVIMVCVAAHSPMILNLMNGFLIRVPTTLYDNRVFNCLKPYRQALLYYILIGYLLRAR